MLLALATVVLSHCLIPPSYRVKLRVDGCDEVCGSVIFNKMSHGIPLVREDEVVSILPVKLDGK